MTTGIKLAATLDATPRPEAGKQQRRNATSSSGGFGEALKADRNTGEKRSAEVPRDVPSTRWAKLTAALEAVVPGRGEVKLEASTPRLLVDSPLAPIDGDNETKAETAEVDDIAVDTGDQKTPSGIDAIFAAILLKAPANAPAPAVQGQAQPTDSGTSGEPEAEIGEGDLPASGAATPRQTTARVDSPAASAPVIAATVRDGKAVTGKDAPTARSSTAAATSIPAEPATAIPAKPAAASPSAPAVTPDSSQPPTQASAPAPAPASASRSPVAAATDPSTTSDERKAETGSVVAKVTVVGEQSIPAPAAQPIPTAAALVDTLAGDAGWRTAVRNVALAQHPGQQSSAAPVHTLKLQLHPAELGMVTANLKFVREQLSIEIQVENAEAYHRLSNDSDTIIKSLRAMGFEIDQVTVQQPQQAVNSNARAEPGTTTQGGMSRDAQSFTSGNSSGNGDRLGGQASGRERGNGGENRETGGQARQERIERGLYI